MTQIGDYLKVFGNVASAIQAENTSTHVSAVNESDVVLYERGYTDYSEEYFSISLTNAQGIQMSDVKSIDIEFRLADGASGDLYYSTDLQTWNIMSKSDNSFYTPSYEFGSQTINNFTILRPRKIYLKGNLSPSLTNKGIGKFIRIKCSANNLSNTNQTYKLTYKLSGNIMSLCWGDAFKAHHNCDIPYYFANLCNSVNGNTGLYLKNLVLPNSLSPYCFYRMFYDCTIYSYPKLPALNLEEGCYMEMFGADKKTTKNNDPLSIDINLDLPAQYIPKKAYTGMLDSYNNKFSGTINMNYVAYENEDAIKLFVLDYASSSSIQQQFVSDALTINMPNCNVYKYNNNYSGGICNYFISYNATTTVGNNDKTVNHEIIKKYDNTNEYSVSGDIKFNTLNTNCNGVNIDNSNSLYTLTYNVDSSSGDIPIIEKSSINNYEFITECTGTLNLYEYNISDMGTTVQYTIIDSQFIEIDNEIPKPIITCEYNTTSQYPNISLIFDVDKILYKLNQSQSPVSTGWVYILFNISNYPFTLNEKFDNNTNNKWNNYIMYCLGNYENFQISKFDIPQNYFEKLHIDQNKQIYIKAQLLLSKHDLNQLKSYSNNISTILLSNETTFSASKQNSYENEYFTVTINSGTNKLACNSNRCQLYYSFDKYNWYILPTNVTNGLQLEANTGKETVYLKGYGVSAINESILNFSTSSPNIILSGNILSLEYGDNFTDIDEPNTYLRYVFFNCTSILDAKHLILPDKNLVDNCYSYMFFECSGLKYPPELPATELASSCYEFMFSGCTSLVYTPLLSAINIDENITNCYRGMFYGVNHDVKFKPIYAKNLIVGTTGPVNNNVFYANETHSNTMDNTYPIIYNKFIDSNFYGWGDNIEYSAIPFEDQYLTQTLLYDGQGKFTIGKLINDYEHVYQIWLDDFDPNETWDYQAYINDPKGNRSNPYYYTGDTLTYNNIKYYIWKYNYELMDEEEGDINSADVKYLFTTTINYSELYNESLEQDTSNVPTLLYGISNNTIISHITYGIQDNDYRIVKIEDKRNISYVAYSINNGESWEYTEIPNFNDEMLIMTPYMPAGSKILWKGKAKSYSNFRTITTDNNFEHIKSYNTYNDIQEVSDFFDTDTIRTELYDSCFFTSNNLYNLSGNIMSLLYGDDFIGQDEIIGDYAFAFLFAGQSELKDAEKLCLPATRLTNGCYFGMFISNSGLINTPMIAATTLQAYSCAYMFNNCENLSNIQRFEVKSLQNGKDINGNSIEAIHACNNMFSGTNITELYNVNLYADKLTACCYYSMFLKTKITTIPLNFLPAMHLSYACYRNMFYWCTNLTHVHCILPALCLASHCYTGMFIHCTSLIDVPENLLLAISLKPYCYMAMFEECSSLATAPVLIAKVANDHSYDGMFASCTSLIYAEVLAEESMNHETAYNNMFSNINTTGTLICRYDINPNIVSEKPSNWSMYHNKYYNNPLTIRNLYSATATINIERGANISGATVYYNILSSTGSLISSSSTIMTGTSCPITLAKTQQVEIIMNYATPANGYTSNNNLQYNNYSRTIHIIGTQDFEAYGNLMSLCCSADTTNWQNNQKSIAAYMFAYLFAHNTNSNTTTPTLKTSNLVKADNLYLPSAGAAVRMYNYTFASSQIEHTPIMPATILSASCYYGMYVNSKKLKLSEALPATIIPNNCYQGMYSGCNSLIAAPDLNATTRPNTAYAGMFADCTSLQYIKMLAVNSNALPLADTFTKGISQKGTFIYNHSITETLPTGQHCIPPNFVAISDLSIPTTLSININIDNYMYGTSDIDSKNPAISIYEGVSTYTNRSYAYNSITTNINISNPTLHLTGTVLSNQNKYYKYYEFKSSNGTGSFPLAYLDTINPKILYEYTTGSAYFQHVYESNETDEIGINVNNYLDNYDFRIESEYSSSTTINNNIPTNLGKISPNITHPYIINFNYADY